MSRPLKPATSEDAQRIASAIRLLKSARLLLRDAKADRAAEKVSKAIASAEGAERHVSTRIQRSRAPAIKIVKAEANGESSCA